eukprot:TCONS_00008802-protein
MNNTTIIQGVNKYCLYQFILWYHIPLLILGITITSVNIFIFTYIRTSKTLTRNAGNYILMGLSLIDACTGFHALLHSIPYYYFISTNTCNNQVFKKYHNAEYLIGKICLLGSIGHLLLLAGERMVGLFRPMHLKSMICKRRVIPMVVLVWLVSIILPLLELTYRYSPRKQYYQQLHVTFTIVGFWILPGILLCVQYIAMVILIYGFQQKHRIDIKSIFLRYKAFVIYLCMFLSFLILCSPHFAVRIMVAFTNKFPHISHDLLRGITILRYLPSLLNPLIYAFFKKDFQRSFSKTLKDIKQPSFRLKLLPWSKNTSPVESMKQLNSEVIYDSPSLLRTDAHGNDSYTI